MYLQKVSKGSGGGSVGRAVASNTRDQQFESQLRQKNYLPIVHLNERTKIKGGAVAEWS